MVVALVAVVLLFDPTALRGGAWMILLRKKLSDSLIALKLIWFRQWNILGSIQSIILLNTMAVRRLRQYSSSSY